MSAIRSTPRGRTGSGTSRVRRRSRRRGAGVRTGAPNPSARARSRTGLARRPRRARSTSPTEVAAARATAAQAAGEATSPWAKTSAVAADSQTSARNGCSLSSSPDQKATTASTRGRDGAARANPVHHATSATVAR
ncbi:hypothetical protein [Thermobifida alba]|uniref:hypothetical protein n=1 Tax=Thermobifida alba TaxID=53522 RepID=UPI0020C0148F|nr:hypothetical protein [Thermobifida alba]HLU98318.1 hypothetical protein [Thermobifida alba]